MSTEEELAAAKEVTRELHAAMKDARSVLRQLVEAKDDLVATIAQLLTGAVDQALEVRTEAALKDYEKTVLTAVDRATASVYKRFDALAEVLLGEDKKSKRTGKPSLLEVAKAVKVTKQLENELE